MEDSEIIELACDVFSKITDDLNAGVYTELGGNLSVRWSEDKCFYAWAAVGSTVKEPPEHYIGLTYDTVLLLYRDIEIYCKYVEHGIDKNILNSLLQDFSYPQDLYLEDSVENCHKNMFISALTWIFFHELGHLVQEHGHIRDMYNCNKNNRIVDCSVVDNDDYVHLTGKPAAVSHVTEMAADFFSTVFCLRALLRHFRKHQLTNEIIRFTPSVALVLYRFQGVSSYIQTETPEGTHPQALIRLEQVMPLIYEFYSNFQLLERNENNLNRLDLINITSWSSFSVGLFWMRKNKQAEISENYFLSGSFQRPGMVHYHQEMIDIWDEVKPEIDKVKRFDDPFSELQFSDQYRKKIMDLLKVKT